MSETDEIPAWARDQAKNIVAVFAPDLVENNELASRMVATALLDAYNAGMDAAARALPLRFDKMKELRLAAGMSVEEAAQIIGRTPTTIYHMEKGMQRLDLDQMKALEAAYRRARIKVVAGQ